MALDKATLASTLTQIFADGQTGAKSQAQVAQAIADAIDAFVKSGTVTTTVTGTDSQGGPVVGVGTGSVTSAEPNQFTHPSNAVRSLALHAFSIQLWTFDWSSSRSPTSHSQMIPTFQPRASSSLVFLRSRSCVARNLCLHAVAFVRGTEARRHPRCLCQKHPCTNTASRYLGSTMSGVPGRSVRWSRNR